MHGAEIAGRAVGDLPRVVSHRRDEVAKRFPRRRLLHGEQRRVGEHARERHELVDLVSSGLALQPIGFRDHGERWKCRHDGVAIRLGARHISVSDPAARAAFVLDDDVAAELLGQVSGERARREISRSARRERHHDRDRACRPGLLRLQVVRRHGSRHEWKRKHGLQQFPAAHHGRVLPTAGSF